VPDAYAIKPSPSVSVYHLKTRDSGVVGQVLDFLEEEEREGRIVSYDILGTTIEDIFLDLMHREQSKPTKTHSASSSIDNLSSTTLVKPALAAMDLPNGRGVSPYRQAFTIFHKRLLIARRAWVTPLLTIAIAVAGATIPLTFTTGLQQLCVPKAAPIVAVPLWLPDAPFAQATASVGSFPWMVVSPPDLLDTFGNLTSNLTVSEAADAAAFTEAVTSGRHTLALGGVSVDQADGSATVAWEASPPGIRAPAMLNMASNVLLHRAVGLSTAGTTSDDPRPVMIATNYGAFAKVARATLMYLRWIFFFGAVMVWAL
jgi:ATP-binding cassette subfamily A (ABC1) protein 3